MATGIRAAQADCEAADRPLWPGLIWTVLASLALTVVIAWPVVRAPQTMIFGREIVGRHHDPFTVMQQFATGGAVAPYRQPLTDDPGVWLARAIGPIAAYNVLVLVSFPLTAFTTYLLGYYLFRSPPGAMVAALAFTFAPVRVAHAAYHVHIVQTEWLALYLLALFAAVDRPTLRRAAALVAAVAALVLSNDYAGLMGAVITPIALPAYWLAQGRSRTWRGFVVPAGSLVVAVTCALVVIVAAAPTLLTASWRFAFPIEDIGRYGAQWWAFWLPPIDHPLLGGLARWALDDSRFSPGILEQQLSLGWSLTALAALGTVKAGLRAHSSTATDRAMLALAVLAVWSFIASLAPGPAGCAPTSLALSCLVYQIVPVFRAYARLGIVTSLCAALLAGYAAMHLLADRRPEGLRWMTGRRILVAALTFVAVEVWPLPGRARDVLPTSAHRWLAGRSETAHVLDCTPWTPVDATLSWLMHKTVVLPTTPFEGCNQPEFVPKLAALHFTHVITRASQPAPWTDPPAGLALAAAFPDGRVYTVSAVAPALVVFDVRGFWEWERKNKDQWRWMGQEGSWTVLNTTTSEVATMLELELESFARPRHVMLELDSQPLPSLGVAVLPREYELGPMAVPPGQHVIRFRAVESAARPIDVVSSQDTRAITIALHSWRWSPIR